MRRLNAILHGEIPSAALGYRAKLVYDEVGFSRLDRPADLGRRRLLRAVRLESPGCPARWWARSYLCAGGGRDGASSKRLCAL